MALAQRPLAPEDSPPCPPRFNRSSLARAFALRIPPPLLPPTTPRPASPPAKSSRSARARRSRRSSGIAHKASLALRDVPSETIARFLELFAAKIEASRVALVDMAHTETALPKKPRLDDVELPRTLNQLRLAAEAARDGSWALPTIDTKAGIRSVFGPLEGGVTVFGPNNFPFAFNSVGRRRLRRGDRGGQSRSSPRPTARTPAPRACSPSWRWPRSRSRACPRGRCSCSTGPITRPASCWSRIR